MQLDKVQLIGLSAAALCIDNASLKYSLKDKKRNTHVLRRICQERFGVYTGTGVGGVTSLMSCLSNHILSPQEVLFKNLRSQLEDSCIGSESNDTIADMEQKMIQPPRFNPFAVSMTMPNAGGARIGIKYSLKGPNNTYCAACSAGTVALGHAFRAIRSGAIDIAMAGGMEYLGDDFGSIFRSFDVGKVLVKNCKNPMKANRPFDKGRSGFLFSEGGCALMMIEELEHARKRDARIFAEITAFAETFDAHSIMIMEPRGKQVRKVIMDALSDAHLSSHEIDYVNAHGTGTAMNDEIEASVIDDIFGKNVLINSTKSLTGHAIGASGAIEAAVTALSIHHKTTHICRNLEDPVRDLGFVTSSGKYSIRKALTQSFAFGGHNAVLVLEACE